LTVIRGCGVRVTCAIRFGKTVLRSKKRLNCPVALKGAGLDGLIKTI
jgi:hypothetical protein